LEVVWEGVFAGKGLPADAILPVRCDKQGETSHPPGVTYCPLSVVAEQLSISGVLFISFYIRYLYTYRRRYGTQPA
jgi:hypothetical protein